MLPGASGSTRATEACGSGLALIHEARMFVAGCGTRTLPQTSSTRGEREKSKVPSTRRPRARPSLPCFRVPRASWTAAARRGVAMVSSIGGNWPVSRPAGWPYGSGGNLTHATPNHCLLYFERQLMYSRGRLRLGSFARPTRPAPRPTRPSDHPPTLC